MRIVSYRIGLRFPRQRFWVQDVKSTMLLRLWRNRWQQQQLVLWWVM